MFALGVHNPKFSQNIGHILRAADAYGASFVAYSGNRKATSCCDTTKAIKRIPTVFCDSLWDVIPYGLVPVAVELCDDAESLIDFIHPKNAFYFFGAEDATLGKLTLERCKHKVYVPTSICMNLSACVNVVLYDRLSKQK
jgi:tRNA(Leu) C34 or U34 (ribose-2'-O)-methylase TrmL